MDLRSYGQLLSLLLTLCQIEEIFMKFFFNFFALEKNINLYVALLYYYMYTQNSGNALRQIKCLR